MYCLLVLNRLATFESSFVTSDNKLSEVKSFLNPCLSLASFLIASQRQTAKVLGVSKDTIRNDIGENSPPKEKTDIEYEEVTEDSGTNVPPTKDIAPAKDWFQN